MGYSGRIMAGKRGILGMFRRFLLAGLLFRVFLLSGVVGATEFRYDHSPGDRYRILSEVDEKVFINGAYSHRANILNKISAHVTEVKEGWAQIEATFITSENREGAVSIYELSQEYDSVFRRSTRGEYDIASIYYMPVVRQVPFFPQGDVKQGESWIAEGHEVHDLRKGYGIPEPFRFPIRVNYRYLGEGLYKGQPADLIEMNYTISYRPGSYYERFPLYPKRISGFSSQLLYWNSRKGQPFAYEENFSILFDLSNGDSYEFVGVAKAELTESSSMDKESVKDDLEKQIADDKIPDTQVRVGEKGVIISMEDIRFQADSVDLLDGEMDKVLKIAEILKRYPERDILVSGHTALAGTAEGRQTLSLERAKKVASLLKEILGIEDKRLMVEGKGATEPIAPNNTVEGMRKNRRVEITILEN